MNRFIINCLVQRAAMQSAAILFLLIALPPEHARADAYSNCIAACNADLAQCKKDNDARLERAQATHTRCTRDADSNHTDRDRDCNRQYRNNPTRLEECLRNSETTHTQDITACDAALSSAETQHHRDSQACDASFDACYGSSTTDENGKTTYTGCQAKRCHCQVSSDSAVEAELFAADNAAECACPDTAGDAEAMAIQTEE